MSCGYGSVDAEDIQKAAKLVGLPMKSHSKAKKLAGALIREDVPLPDGTGHRAADMAVRLVLLSNRQPSVPPLFQRGKLMDISSPKAKGMLAGMMQAAMLITKAPRKRRGSKPKANPLTNPLPAPAPAPPSKSAAKAAGPSNASKAAAPKAQAAAATPPPPPHTKRPRGRPRKHKSKVKAPAPTRPPPPAPPPPSGPALAPPPAAAASPPPAPPPPGPSAVVSGTAPAWRWTTHQRCSARTLHLGGSKPPALPLAPPPPLGGPRAYPGVAPG